MIPITTREQEILQLISQGYSSKEIAASLFLSNHTIESHRKNLLIKLEAQNVAHMVTKGFEYGCLRIQSLQL